MRIYLRDKRTKFYSDPIWNDGDLGYFEEIAHEKQQRRE